MPEKSIEPKTDQNVRNVIREPIALTAVLIIIIWSTLIASSLYWNVDNLRKEKINLAIAEAKSNWNKDQAFRKWASKHGGLYVKPDARTPPNPYLAHLPHRDVETVDGIKLTLMNPAYMMRQMTQEYEKTYGIMGSITGKILLNPINAADDWETKALTQFEKGQTEVIEKTEIEGEPYLRYMKPMYMKESCVKCHGHLGFKAGDLRGGVSVSIPLKHYFGQADIASNTMAISHASVWGAGCLGIFGFFWSGRRRDLARISIQKQLNLYQDQLEDRVKERTRDLEKAKDEADKANHSKSEFLSRMSHELRTPLNAILGFAQLLEDDLKKKKYDRTEDVDEILNAGQLLLELVNEVLELSYIESGKRVVNRQYTNTKELVESCLQLIKNTAELKNITVMTEFDDCQCQIYVDEKMLKQILINFLSNSIKYNRENGTIFVSCEKLNNGRSRISVRDTGIGIESENFDKLFEPFERLGFQSEDIEGSGVGLAVCKTLVTLMNGEIGVESTVGEGSIFWIEIPGSK